MNFYILLFLIYVGCEDVDQEKPTPIFMKTFGGTLWDYGNYVQQTKEGGYIIVGETSLIENGSSDIWLIKTDFHGNGEWIKTFDGSFHQRFLSTPHYHENLFLLTKCLMNRFLSKMSHQRLCTHLLWFVERNYRSPTKCHQMFS